MQVRYQAAPHTEDINCSSATGFHSAAFVAEFMVRQAHHERGIWLTTRGIWRSANAAVVAKFGVILAEGGYPVVACERGLSMSVTATILDPRLRRG